MDKKYEKTSILQQGTYGTVWKGINKSNEELVAIKECRTTTTSKREIAALSKLSHPNIVKLLDYCIDDDQSILVFEYVGIDLFEYIQSNYPLQIAQIKRFLYSLLDSISYLHQQGLMHRDITATNILVDEKMQIIKLCDFGLSKYLSKGPHTPKMCTLQYSAPELLIGSTVYDNSVDLWACGCVFLEMILGIVPFDANSEVKILHQQFSLLGTPPREKWPELPSTVNIGNFQSTLREVVPSEIDEKGIDLIEKLLSFSPLLRISAKQALKHPFFSDLDNEQKK